MMDGIAMCAAAMDDAQRRLERSTAELANAETDGFGRQLAGARARTSDPLRPTGNPLDLAVHGPGALRVVDTAAAKTHAPHGVALRAATFHRDLAGYLVDDRGRALLGTSGPIRIPAGADFRPDGSVVADGGVVARVLLPPGAELRSGFTLGSNVNAIGEMVVILDAQRSFETAQKTLSAIDAARQKATSDVGHLQ